MTVPVQSPLSLHVGNGVSTAFAYSFLLLSADDLRVTVDGVLLQNNLNYSITGLSNEAGGSVVFALPPAASARVVLRRNVSLSRLTDYQYAGDFLAATVNRDFDRVWMALQDYAKDVENALRLPPDDDSNPVLPAVADRALMLLGFNAAGQLAVLPATAGDASALALALASSSNGVTQGAALVGIDGGNLYDYFRSKVSRSVPSIAALRLLPKAAIQNATVTGYYAAGDGGGGEFHYDASDSTSADDGVLVIVAADGGRWKRHLEGLLNVKAAGAVGDGVTDDRAAIVRGLAAANGRTLLFPAGTYIVSAPIVVGSGKNPSIVGESRTGSIIKAGTLTLNGNPMIFWQAASGFEVRNITIDFNSRPVTVGSEGVIGFQNCSNFDVSGCNIIRLTGSGIGANGIQNFRFTGNYFMRAGAAGVFNQAISISSAISQSSDGEIVSNYLLRSAINISVTRCRVSGNSILNWGFGAGITTEQDTVNSNFYEITNNNISGGAGTDVNAYNPGGIENWGAYSTISGNVISGCSGSGIDQGGQHTTVSGNICFNNGQTAGSGIVSRYGNATYNSSYSIYTGNRCFDTQSTKTQSYGYQEQSGGLVYMSVFGNNFNGAHKVGSMLMNSTLRNFTGSTLNSFVGTGSETIANGASASWTVTVPGATPGDIVTVSHTSDLQGVALSGDVTASNSVRVTASNVTGASKTIAAGRVYCRVSKNDDAAQF